MQIYDHFANLFDYPSADLPRQATALWDSLQKPSGLSGVEASAGSSTQPQDPATALASFCSFLEATPLPRVEEIYTHTFDLSAVCHPYLGYHLFGESYKRGEFMAELNKGYRERGFSAGQELPDHISVVLRFLAQGTGDDFGRALLKEGLVPALSKMAKSFREESSNPYAGVLDALLAVVTGTEREMGDA